MPIEKFTPRYTFTEDRLAELKQVVPEAFADGKINWNTLKEALGEYLEDDEADAEHFGLTWPGKRQARRLAALPSKGALAYSPEEGIDSENTEHVFIEGDNLEVLKLMQKAYDGRVNLVYIDPPYNTGNDHVYKDDFSEPLDDYLRKTGQKGDGGESLTSNPKSSGRFHSDWLNMMYPRLRLARNLLRDDGVMFVSCDNVEVHHLRQLLSEICGEENIIGIIANISNPKGRSDDRFLATSHEYLIVVAKNAICTNWGGFSPEEHITRRYTKLDKNGNKYREIDLRKTGDSDRRQDRPEMFYYFYYSKTTDILRLSKAKEKLVGDEIAIIPLREDGQEGRWRWGFDTAVNRIDSVIPRFMPNRQIWGVFEKDYLEGRSLVKPTSSWSFKEVNSERGSEQFIDLGFPKEVFSRPKPIGTIQRILDIGSPSQIDSAIILDFFAGSGTTAHAVMRRNATNGISHRYILVQLPEPLDPKKKDQTAAAVFCEKLNKPLTLAEITKERIRRAAKKIQEDNPEYTGDLGFKVFKLGTSQFRAWDDVKTQDLRQLQLAFESTETPLIEDWNADTVYFEILLQEGFPLHSRWEALSETTQEVWIASEGEIEHRLFICLEDKLNKKTINALMATLADNDIFVCFDRALNDETKAQLMDSVRLRVL